MSLLSAQTNRGRLWLCLFILFTFSAALSLTVGSVRIPLFQIIRILGGQQVAQNNWGLIVLEYRLPKLIVAALAGAALSVAGLQMQTLFRNPLADPFILGISSGANLGAALVILAIAGNGVHFLSKISALGNFQLTVAASLGALMVFLIIMILARRVHTMTLLITGVLIGYIVNAMVRILIQAAMPDAVQAYLSWTFGSFAGIAWSEMKYYAPFLMIALLSSLLTIRSLNALLLGDIYARSLGVNPQKVRWLLIINASIMTGIVTAYCGLIGFIGMAVPHLCRSLFSTSDHLTVLPASALLGAIIAILADLLTQVVGGSFMLPLNSVTAILGGPVILWVLLKKKNLSRVFDR
ncbi:MAG: iron ABC transporter permease [Anaerolineaceae bacterium]|nr:iron ABC transporter permease [Anaerolineaceae bacterium]